MCGNGFATEAATAVLRYVMEELDLRLVRADVDEPNAGSINVLENLGMKQVSRAMVEGRWLLYYEIRFDSGTISVSLCLCGELS